MTNLVKSNAQQTSAPLAERGWIEAVHLLTQWMDHRERVDVLLERIPPRLSQVERAHCQGLLLGVVRHHDRLIGMLKTRLQHPPRRIVEAILFVGAFELLDAKEEKTAKVVHYCVDQAKRLASPVEARLVNAVLRRVSEDVVKQQPPGKLASASVLAGYYSHPEWLVARWLALYGAGSTHALLRWNSEAGEVFARWRAGEAAIPDWLLKTEWPGFFRVEPGHWPEVERALSSAQLFIQDPATRLAIDLLDPKPGETVLDLCAAPGGKSVAIADRMGSGLVVSVDLPGERQKRLEENLARVQGVQTRRIVADVAGTLSVTLAEANLPSSYGAVFIDVPCSNTGVMRHRIDVKERLQPGDFARHAAQQLRLLTAASRYVAPGGRLVYSTCSIDPEENKRVVDAFLKKNSDRFSLEESCESFPWEAHHDGMCAFRLRRINQ